MKLTEQQQTIVQLVADKKNVFITGPAGTGKTHTIKAITIMAKQKDLQIGVTASTGSAAILIGGKTIHSFLGIGTGEYPSKTLANFIKHRHVKRYSLLRKLELLILDEISMISDELFTKISEVLCILRKNNDPFGGVQLVICGDFYQLPPVQGNFCFKTKTWTDMKLHTCMLTYNFRQSQDTTLQEILTNIRKDSIQEKDMELLKKCSETVFQKDILPTCIYPLNSTADIINTKAYHRLLKKVGEISEVVYPTMYQNKKSKQFADKYKIPQEIRLCPGAQVMITRNIDQDRNIVNGTRGIVTQLEKEKVCIKLLNNKTLDVSYYSTKIEDDEDKASVVSFNHIPLMLAYGITIHKSQGVTLDAAEIDLGEDIFEYGQAYTALSRIKNLQTVRIPRLSKRSFRNHPEVVEFYRSLSNSSI